jgi:hypothetical protein
MIEAGELPPPACVGCGDVGEETVPASAECERAWESGGGRGWWVAFFLFGLLGALLLRARGEGRTYGRNLYVPVTFRLCGRCRCPSPRTGLFLFLRVLKFGLLVVGAALTFAEPVLGAPLVVAGVLLWWVETATRRGRQAAIKRLLRRVPVYRQLLGDYPDAIIVWGNRPED